MSETKEESNSTSDVKEEKSNEEEDKTLDESSKDSDKDNAKDEVKKESGKESAKEESEEEDDDESDEGMGLLDRPVEVSGCRARKQVERLEVSFSQPKEKQQEIPIGRGDKFGDCARIEYQISKTGVNDLKPLHRVLFSRVGSVTEIKKNIRKFSGFTFDKGSTEYVKKKAQLEKFTLSILKRMCEIVDIEIGGTKEAVITRLLDFLLEPKDSGKALPKKKSSKDKKKSVKKTANSKKPKSSDEHDSANESASEDVSEEEEKSDEIDDEPKKKSKNAAKVKKTPAKTKKTEKKEKSKKEEKKGSAKRKREDSSSDSADEPISKKIKMPSDDDIKKLVKQILDTADLQEITMKKVIKQVAEAYPDCDLSHKKAFIKTTIKSVIS